MTDLKAAASGFSLDAKYRTEQGSIYLTGVQALVRVLIEQRRADRRRGYDTAGLVSGYPGSPLGGVDLELERQRVLLEEHDILHVPGLNEDLAATALWGSQTVGALPDPRVQGVFGMWFGKAPGVDRSGDVFRTSNMRGVASYGGVLCVAGDDPDARSTNYPTDSNNAFYDWSMPILFPGSVQEVLDLGLHGYALSRASGLWVGFKMVTDVADGAGTAVTAPDRIVPILTEVLVDGVPFSPTLRVNEVGAPLKAAERDLRYGRLKLAEAYIRSNNLNPIVLDGDAACVGLVASGKAYHDLRKAFDLLDLDDAALCAAGIRIKKVSALFPVDPEEWREFARDLDEVIVVEEKRPFLERFLKESLYGAGHAPRIVGKRDEAGAPFLPEEGEFTADLLARIVGERLRARFDVLSVNSPLRELPQRRPLIPLSVNRTPYFCSGCPHNRSLIVPEGSVVGAGIGCHIMELVVPRDEYGTLSGFTQMGGEGAQWVGAAPFTEIPHIFQNVGDGTFHHSGSLALRFAVSANANITFKLLYNSAVGMTGGQDVSGAMAVPELTHLLAAEGVRRTIVTTDDPKKYRRVKLAAHTEVWHRDRLIEAQEVLAATPGVTVLLHDQYCAAEKRRLRKRDKIAEPTQRIFINDRVCEGCGDCGRKSQCLSVQPLDTEFGRKTTIHQSSCNLDYSCVLGDCPSFLTVETKHAQRQQREVPAPPTELPVPVPRVPTDRFNVHMTGIGGTGVVTMSQVLATAAVLEGRLVRNIDHTGASQKAGPVVSQLQVYRDEEPSSTIAEGEADTLLAFDALGAMAETNLAKVGVERTVVIASTSRVPTGAMASQPDLPYPAVDVLRAELDSRSRADENVYLDIQAIAAMLFDTHMVANTILVGAALQAGAIPLKVESVREAIRLNGTAVDKNLAALEWGRAAVARPDSIELRARADSGELTPKTRHAIELIDDLDPVGPLRAVLDVRVPDLIDFQNVRYARRYLDTVRIAVVAERAASSQEGEFSVQVAKGLHKLMAYKDEYEVARLHLDHAATAAIAKEFGGPVKISWNLHPPVLRALGMKRKLKLGPWFRPVLQGLAAGKKLRGTPVDLFGYARVRRIERALIRHYAELVRHASAKLSPDTAVDCVAIAQLPGIVSGYEEIKLANVRSYIESARQLAARLDIPDGIDGELVEFAAHPLTE